MWVHGLYNSGWFCVHKLSMFIYLSMVPTHMTKRKSFGCSKLKIMTGKNVDILKFRNLSMWTEKFGIKSKAEKMGAWKVKFKCFKKNIIIVIFHNS